MLSAVEPKRQKRRFDVDSNRMIWISVLPGNFIANQIFAMINDYQFILASNKPQS